MAETTYSDFDRIVNEIQREIVAQERAVYSDRVVTEAFNPRNLGRMEEADGQAVVTGWCGDTMEFYLRVSDGRIVEVTFMTDGCGPTVACGSMLTGMVQGKALGEVRAVDPDELIEALGGLPEENLHCADLAVNTLRQAIADYERA